MGREVATEGYQSAQFFLCERGLYVLVQCLDVVQVPGEGLVFAPSRQKIGELLLCLRSRSSDVVFDLHRENVLFVI